MSEVQKDTVIKDLEYQLSRLGGAYIHDKDAYTDDFIEPTTANIDEFNREQLIIHMFEYKRRVRSLEYSGKEAEKIVNKYYALLRMIMDNEQEVSMLKLKDFLFHGHPLSLTQ